MSAVNKMTRNRPGLPGEAAGDDDDGRQEGDDDGRTTPDAVDDELAG